MPEEKSMKSNATVISFYPLSKTFLEAVEKQIGVKVVNFVVSAVKAGNYFDMYRVFAQQKGRTLYIKRDSINDPRFVAMQLIGALGKFEKRYVLDEDLAIHPDRGLQLGANIVHGFVSIIKNLLAIRYAFRDVNFLFRAPKQSLAEKISFDRVLYLKSNLWMGLTAGGSITHTTGVINALLKNKSQVDYWGVEAPKNINHSDYFKNCVVEPRNMIMPPRISNFVRFERQIFKKIIATVGEGKYSVIYHRLSAGCYLAVVLSRIFRIPLVVEYNGSEVWISENWGKPFAFRRFAQLAEDVVLRHADVIVTVSEVLRAELVQRSLPAEKIIAIANGVDIEVFSPNEGTHKNYKTRTQLRAELNVTDADILYSFVGTFGQWHGVEIFAEGFIKLVQQNKSRGTAQNIRALFVGDGVLKQHVQDMIDAAGCQDYVTFTGLVPHNEVVGYLRASDVLMSPHRKNPDATAFFGSPTKLFEYLACGRPVIVSDLAQIGDVFSQSPLLVNNKSELDAASLKDACGIRVVPDDVDALVAAMQFLAENEDCRKALGSNARKLAEEKYTWDSNIKTLVDFSQNYVSRGHQKSVSKKSVKVLINAIHARSGGGVTYLRNILPVFAKDQRIEVHLLIQSVQKDIFGEVSEWCQVHTDDRFGSGARMLMLEQIFVPRIAQKIGADVIFSPANYGPLLAGRNVIMLRNTTEVGKEETRFSKRIYWYLLSLMTHASLRKCVSAIAVSHYARNALFHSDMASEFERCRVIYHGVNERFRSVERQENQEQPFMLAVSDVYIQKNFHTLLTALGRLKQKGQVVTLKIAGSILDQSYYKTLQEIILEYGLEEQVHFLGKVQSEELRRLYATCRCFIFPSTAETFGNPLVEAMASGAPVLTSVTTAMPEIVGDAAVLFDPNASDEIMAAIIKLWSEPDLREELSVKGRQRAASFSWEETARKTVETLLDAAG